MPAIDLSTLTTPELNRLLRLARGMHDGPLIDRLEWEMAERASLSTRAGFDVGAPLIHAAEPPDETGVSVARADGGPPPLQLYALPRQERAGLPWVAAGLVAGCLLSGVLLWSTSGLAAWRLSVKVEPSVPRAMTARATPAVRPPPATPTSSGDAVVGVLAPEPLPPPQAPPVQAAAPAVPTPAPAEATPEPAPVELAQAAPPQVAEPPPPPVEAAAPEPAPKPEPATKTEAAPRKDPAPAKKTELAAKKPGKSRAALAAKEEPPSKAKLATKAKPSGKTELAAARPSTRKATAAKARPEPRKVLAAKKTPDKETRLARAEPKPMAKKPAVKAVAKAEPDDPIGAILADTAAR